MQAWLSQLITAKTFRDAENAFSLLLGTYNPGDFSRKYFYITGRKKDADDAFSLLLETYNPDDFAEKDYADIKVRKIDFTEAYLTQDIRKAITDIDASDVATINKLIDVAYMVAITSQDSSEMTDSTNTIANLIYTALLHRKTYLETKLEINEHSQQAWLDANEDTTDETQLELVRRHQQFVDHQVAIDRECTNRLSTRANSLKGLLHSGHFSIRPDNWLDAFQRAETFGECEEILADFFQIIGLHDISKDNKQAYLTHFITSLFTDIEKSHSESLHNLLQKIRFMFEIVTGVTYTDNIEEKENLQMTLQTMTIELTRKLASKDNDFALTDEFNHLASQARALQASNTDISTYPESVKKFIAFEETEFAIETDLRVIQSLVDGMHYHFSNADSKTILRAYSQLRSLNLTTTLSHFKQGEYEELSKQAIVINPVLTQLRRVAILIDNQASPNKSARSESLMSLESSLSILHSELEDCLTNDLADDKGIYASTPAIASEVVQLISHRLPLTNVKPEDIKKLSLQVRACAIETATAITRQALTTKTDALEADTLKKLDSALDTIDTMMQTAKTKGSRVIPDEDTLRIAEDTVARIRLQKKTPLKTLLSQIDVNQQLLLLQDNIWKTGNKLDLADDNQLAFINALNQLKKQLTTELRGQDFNKGNYSRQALTVILETNSMLTDLNKDGALEDKNTKLDILKHYQQKLKPSRAGIFFKAVMTIVITGLFALLGAAAGAFLGTMAGCWSGPGAAATAVAGLAAGTVKGAAIGLVVATGVTGLTAGALSGALFFKPSNLNKRTEQVVKTLKMVPHSPA